MANRLLIILTGHPSVKRAHGQGGDSLLVCSSMVICLGSWRKLQRMHGQANSRRQAKIWLVAVNASGRQAGSEHRASSISGCSSQEFAARAWGFNGCGRGSAGHRRGRHAIGERSAASQADGRLLGWQEVHLSVEDLGAE